MPHIVVGTAGHIDHGKSALVLALTGTDPDRLKEEKARGITIDLGFAHWEAPGLGVAFVDVPGHERFIKNMLAGVGGIDAVLLVVAADESVMPQTREHFDICRLLQVPAGIIVLTKADLVDSDLLGLAELEVRELVRGSFLEHAPIVAVSSKTGEGLAALKETIAGLGARVTGRSSKGPVRLPIDRVFSVKGFGTVVTGTLVSGSLAVDDQVDVLPRERTVNIRGLQVHGATQTMARAGQRVAANLGGIDVSSLARGDTLVSTGTFTATRVLNARIEVLPSVRPLRHGARIRFHQGTSEVIGRVAVSSLCPLAGVDDPLVAVELPPGRSAYVRIRLEAHVVVTRGDRFILRAYSPPLTVAGGAVLDPVPPKAGIRTAAGRERFRQIDPALPHPEDETPDQRAIHVMMTETGPSGLDQTSVISRGGLSPEEAGRVVDLLLERRTATRIAGRIVAVRTIDALAARVLQMLRDFHRDEPLRDGMPREEVRGRLFAPSAPGLFDRVLDDLVAGGSIVARDHLALASHRVGVSGDEADARSRIEHAFREARLTPPDVGEVATALGLRVELTEKMAMLLVRQRVLVKVDSLLVHESALTGLKADVVSLKAASVDSVVKLDVAAFKQRYGVTRKYAIPLLEYLDRERVTRRVGDSRIVL